MFDNPSALCYNKAKRNRRKCYEKSNGGHGSPLLKCDQLADIVHEIAEKRIEIQH